MPRSLFLRGLAVIYLIAFASLLPQIDGLIGVHGVLPARDYLENIHSEYGASAYVLFPTLAWLNSSDLFLHVYPRGNLRLSFFRPDDAPEHRCHLDPHAGRRVLSRSFAQRNRELNTRSQKPGDQESGRQEVVTLFWLLASCPLAPRVHFLNNGSSVLITMSVTTT
jgi:hypothetical protein